MDQHPIALQHIETILHVLGDKHLLLLLEANCVTPVFVFLLVHGFLQIDSFDFLCAVLCFLVLFVYCFLFFSFVTSQHLRPRYLFRFFMARQILWQRFQVFHVVVNGFCKFCLLTSSPTFPKIFHKLLVLFSLTCG